METQRCLYEILGVERTASIDEIRSAYRKLALKWHPDKIQQTGASSEACQEATIQFQEIGRAYEVLGDPSERSWYDSHRTQILSSSSSSSTPSDFDFNPWPFFSASAFTGYGDTGKGFFAVYGEIFTKLHQQEKGFAHAHGMDLSFDPPDMGNLSTPYPQVQKFYNHWLGFSTVKDFAWCDEFKVSEGPNRKIRRLMEEENKKIRSKHRKEFNEAIRRLAAFVRKRDKRVLERQIEVQRLEKEKEEMRKARRKREEEEKMMKARLYEEAEWTKVEVKEHSTDDGSDVDDSIGSYAWGATHTKSKKDDQQDELYCIVCSKKFKSDKQWRNHEKSKKHLEKVATLKESFEEDDRDFDLISHDNLHDDALLSQTSAISEATTVESPSTSDVDKKKVLKRGTDSIQSNNAADNGRIENDGDESSQGIADEILAIGAESESDDGASGCEDDELSSLLTMVNSYTSRQHQSKSEDGDESSFSRQHRFDENEEVRKAEEEVVEEEEEEKEEEEEEDMLAAMLKSHQNQQPLKHNEDQESGLESSSSFGLESDKEGKPNGDRDGGSKNKKSKGRLRSEKQQAASLSRHSTFVEELSGGKEAEDLMHKCEASGINKRDPDCLEQERDGDLVSSDKNTGKAEKVEKRPSRENPSSRGKSMNGRANDLEQPRRPARGKKSRGNAKHEANTCETCGEDFDSRNQLFKHISLTKHAIFKGK